MTIHLTLYEITGTGDANEVALKVGCEAFEDHTIRVVDAGVRDSPDACVEVLHAIGVSLGKYFAGERYRDGAHLHVCIEFGCGHHDASKEATHGEGVRREEAGT